VPLDLQNRINAWLQPLKGIGEDVFALNEHFAEDGSILDFETLFDYDRDDHAFQQDAKQRDLKGYQPEPYTGALHGTWARVLVDGPRRGPHTDVQVTAGDLHGNRYPL